MQTKIIIDKNEGETNVLVKPEVQRELARFGLARTDDKPRGEAEFTQTIPKYRANESRVKLAWLCRVQPIFNES